MGDLGTRKRKNRRIKVYIFKIKGDYYVYCDIDGERVYKGPLEQELEYAKKLLAKVGPKEVEEEIRWKILKEEVLERAQRGLEALDKLIRGAGFDIAEYDGGEQDIMDIALAAVYVGAYYVINGLPEYGARIILHMLRHIRAFEIMSRNWAVEKGRMCKSPGEVLAERYYKNRRINAFKAFYERIRRMIYVAVEHITGRARDLVDDLVDGVS